MLGQAVLVIIIVLRCLVPLGIPKFPLPFLLAALVIDAADQTILAAVDAEPANYQQYDKALDTYYLTIAYISTIRNWTVGTAFRVAQFLWYYRLIGVAAFELTFERSLLLIFPNTFEFFFIFYEAVRTRWEPSRLPKRIVIGAAAGIWIIIKLPQEFFIHVAQLDFTTLLAENPILIPIVLAVIAAIGFVGYLVKPLIPPIDWPTSWEAEGHMTTVFETSATPQNSSKDLINHPLFEKTILVALVTTIFLQLAPNPEASVIEIIFGVGIIVVASSYLGHFLCRFGKTKWGTTFVNLLATSVVNVAAVLIFRLWPPETTNGGLGILFTFFLLTLLTLITVLYDRYRSFRLLSEKTWVPTQQLTDASY